MAKYRKKPVVVEAEQFGGKYEVAGMCFGHECDILWAHIHTLEGVMHVSKGDYIIRGVQGECYPCKPDIFEQTYEQVEDSDG